MNIQAFTKQEHAMTYWQNRSKAFRIFEFILYWKCQYILKLQAKPCVVNPGRF